MYYDENGHEVPDPTPIALPIGFKRPESLQEQIARMVRSHFLLGRQAEGYETPEEADDLDPDDGEPDFSSRWELPADAEDGPMQLLKAESRGQVAPSPATGGAPAPDAGVGAAPGSGPAGAGSTPNT